MYVFVNVDAFGCGKGGGPGKVGEGERGAARPGAATNAALVSPPRDNNAVDELSRGTPPPAPHRHHHHHPLVAGARTVKK